MAVSKLAKPTLCTDTLFVTGREALAVKAPLTLGARTGASALDHRCRIGQAKPRPAEHLLWAVNALRAGRKALPFNAHTPWAALAVEGTDDLGRVCWHALTGFTSLIGRAITQGVALEITSSIQAYTGESAVVVDHTEVLWVTGERWARVSTLGCLRVRIHFRGVR